MVTSVTALGRNGVHDWLIQRVSAVVIALYTLFLVAYFLVTPNITYSDWQALFSLSLVKYFTLLTIISIALHAWVGLWIVLMDYVKPRFLRVALLSLIVLASFMYVLWTIDILWN